MAIRSAAQLWRDRVVCLCLVMNRMVILLVALALLIVPAACTEVTSTAKTITVLQLNICHGGTNPACYRGDAALTKAAEVIKSNKPDVVSVNEACAGDIERLRPVLAPARALFVAARDLDGTPALCRGSDQQYGNIIMVASRFAGTAEESGTYTAQYTAPKGNRELRAWACLRAADLSACTTHLSSDNAPTALAQCRELMSRAAGYPRPAIVVGDFNLKDEGSPGMRDCDSAGFSRRGDGDVQHLYAADGLTFAHTATIDMAGSTDHPGFLITLRDR